MTAKLWLVFLGEIEFFKMCITSRINGFIIFVITITIANLPMIFLKEIQLLIFSKFTFNIFILLIKL